MKHIKLFTHFYISNNLLYFLIIKNMVQKEYCFVKPRKYSHFFILYIFIIYSCFPIRLFLLCQLIFTLSSIVLSSLLSTPHYFGILNLT
jgi:hypothetical protein